MRTSWLAILALALGALVAAEAKCVVKPRKAVVDIAGIKNYTGPGPSSITILHGKFSSFARALHVSFSAHAGASDA